MNAPEPLDALWLPLLLPSPQPRQVDALVGLSSAQWQAILERVQSHAVAALFYHQLTGTGAADRLPPAQLAQLQQIYRRQMPFSLTRRHELQQILAALAERQIRPLLFKGAVWAYNLYPAPTCRPLGDFDLWLAPDEMEEAQAALAALGYRSQTKEARPLALQEMYDGELQMVRHSPSPAMVELHWGIFAGEWMQRVAQIDRAGVRRRAVRVDLLGHEVLALAPEDEVIQTAIHVSVNHHMSRNALRSLVDLAWLAQRPVDWSVVAERSRAWRLAHAVAFPLQMLNEIFGREIVPARALPTAISPARLGWLRRFVTVQSLLRGERVPTSSRRYLYLLGLTDQPVGLLSLLTGSLWPEDRWLLARYGRADLRTRLAHLLAAAQGRI